MVENFHLTDVDAELVATMGQTDARPSDDTPFRIALIGDWSGRANRGLLAGTAELSEWRPLLVDRDNLDQIMARLGVKLNLPVANDGSLSLAINFNQLDDFHPDRIFERVDVFETLRQIRARLRNPATFAEAAAEVRKWSEVSTLVPPTAATSDQNQTPSKPEETEASSGGSLLDQILKGPGSDLPTATKTGPDVSPDIGELVKEAVKPYLLPDNEAEIGQLIAAVDSRIASQINAILHQADFQALEAAWRALDFLVMRLETGTELKLYLLDVSAEELKADLRSNEGLRATAMYRLLVDQTVGTSGGVPWAVIAANYTFDFTSDDRELIERISLIAKAAGAPFIAAATSQLAGCGSLVDTPDPDDWQEPPSATVEEWWKNIRNIPSAAYVGFALLRFLLRLPYGKDTDPTEKFEYEEMTSDGGPRHESYLWANPAFAVSYLLARGFSDAGWDFRPSDYQEIEGLPLHVYELAGESQIKPCAEVLLTLRAAEKIIERGLMPLLSIKNSDTVRLGMFQAIAGASLAGRWNRG